MSRHIEVASELRYTVQAPTTLLLQIAAASTDHQSLESESLETEPALALESCRVGPRGNRLHRLRVEQAGPVTVRYRARVALAPRVARGASLAETPHSALPPEVLPYLNPSRYCESDRLAKFAFEEFGALEPGHARVERVIDWVNAWLDYTLGSTGPSTTACDVLIGRAGVCRDYAHLAIALLRALGLPARYVSGYAAGLEPPDFHGFCEVWLGDDWFLFDATRLAPIEGLVRIGAGRDAADCAFATLFGQAQGEPPAVSARALDGEEDSEAEGDDSDDRALSSA